MVGKRHRNSAANLYRNRASNCLIVEEIPNNDNSVALMSEYQLEALDLMRGDTIMIKGRCKKNTILIALIQDDIDNGKICINKSVRNNLKVRLGDLVTVRYCSDVANGRKIHILPVEDTLEGIVGNLYEIYLKPYFHESYRPARKGDLFCVDNGIKTVEFKIIDTDPGEYCIVCPDTVICCEGDPIKRTEKKDDVSYNDIGGYRKQLALIREIIEIPTQYPQLFTVLGAKLPQNILLYGPHGSGKTLISRAIANETESFFILLSGLELINKTQEELEAALRLAFENAQKNSPAIIFIDDIDLIATKREAARGEIEDRVTSQLLMLIDEAKTRGKVTIIGATSRINCIDPAFRRFGRFDRDIGLGIPDESDRMEILRIHTRDMKVSDDFDISELSKSTNGFVGADLEQLCAEAAMNCIREKLNLLNPSEGRIDSEILDEMAVTQSHFLSALKVVSLHHKEEKLMKTPRSLGII